MKLLAITFSVLFYATPILAQSVTIGGNVKDKVSLAWIDSAVVSIVNTGNSSERYSVATNPSGAWLYTFTPGSVEQHSDVPASFTLEQNYPNPFNPSTRIGFTLGTSGTVRITVHNVLGQELDAKTLMLEAGSHEIDWTSRGSAGALFYTIEMNGMRQTRKMIQLDRGGRGGLGNVVTMGRVASVSGLAKKAVSEYYVIVSKFLYMPDTTRVTLTNGTFVQTALETIHNNAFLFDLHNDALEVMINGYFIGVRHTINHSDLPRFRDGGVDAQMFSVWADEKLTSVSMYQRSLTLIDTFMNQVNRVSDQMIIARNADEVMAGHAAGKFVGVFGLEGGYSIEESLQKLDTLYARGIRYMTLTWNNSTSWAISAADSKTTTQGLSEFGKEVIRRMDSLGIIVDVSHVGIKTIDDVLKITKNPIIASHSGVRALRNSTRDLYDNQIDSIAAHGGVIGVVFYPPFLSAFRPVTIDTVVKHIDYIKNLVGVDYVALGSDFDGIEQTPMGLEDVSKFPALTAALLRKGYSIADIRKILGENYLRVMRKVCR
jgi:membrane dipeptidase